MAVIKLVLNITSWQ